MEITEQDFSMEFWERFGDKEKQYILDFCNTFYKTFPGIIAKEDFINKISRLQSIKPDSNKRLQGNETGLTIYQDMEVLYSEGLDEFSERNTVYHELFHVLSYRELGGITADWGLYRHGIVIDNGNYYTEYTNNNMEGSRSFDEIMNEFYTIKMLQTEGMLQEEKEWVIQKRQPFNTSLKYPDAEILTKYFGNGYQNRVFLAGIYDELFGEELLKAKIIDRTEFVEKFNERFKGIDIKTKDEEYRPNYSKIGIQIGENIGMAINTALNIWQQIQLEKMQNGELDLYSYLKSSNTLVKALPNVQRDRNFSGNINNEVMSGHEQRIHGVDEQTVMTLFRPDLVGNQEDPKKQNEKAQFLAVIDTLRDHMDDLTREDLENLSYGEMSQYMHSNMYCTVINAGDKSFMTFASTDGFMGSSMFSKLPKDKTQEIFGDTRNVEYATIPTVRYTWSIIKDENGFIPLVQNPNMEHAELKNEIYIDGAQVINDISEKTTRKKTKPYLKANIIDEKNRKQVTHQTRKNAEIGKTDTDNQMNELKLRQRRRTILFRSSIGKLTPEDQEKLDHINEILGPEENMKRRNNFGNNKKHGNSR